MDEAAEAALPPSPKAATTVQVALITDGHAIRDGVEALLAATFGLRTLCLDDALDGDATLPPVAVFCLSRLQMGDAKRIADAAARHAMHPIFVFPSYKLAWIETARDVVDDVDCFTPPLDNAGLVATVRQALNGAVENGWSHLQPAEATALRSSKQGFDSLLEAAANGEPLPLARIGGTCEKIQASLGASNVNRWLGALRLHHDNTYRHSMFVCGVLAFFARSLGIKGDDLRELTVGGFLHDAGKAKIPLAILDKPAKLDPDEWAVMRTHPTHSRDILLREHGLSPRIVRMAVHHHEKLDGGGYPDALKAAQIDDAVRLTAIADVYAALAEQRAYKPAMPPEKALEIMAGFEGHLDMDLLRAFRTFILDQDRGQASVAA